MHDAHGKPGQLHHRILLLVAEAQAAGTSTPQAVDELAWALATFGHAHDLNPRAVRRTVAVLQAALQRHGLLA
jgi:hypothetical protein